MMVYNFKSVLLAMLCLVFLQTQSIAQAPTSDKYMLVSLRMIGHQVLLSAGDSTSRVLPIVVEDHKYRIEFEREIAIRPDDLFEIVEKVSAETNLASNYIIEVEECGTNEIVYAYQSNGGDSTGLVPCRGRDLPRACYNLLFTFIDDALPIQVSGSSESSVSWSYWIYFLILFSVLTPVFAVLYFSRKRKGGLANNPNLISLGKYHFDKLNAELIIEEQRIELTSKEADLLMLLYETANETVEREVLLNKVWGDEGDYIGRTLDVFISKLRKKLEFDSGIKIVNVRGVGYKLILAG